MNLSTDITQTPAYQIYLDARKRLGMTKPTTALAIEEMPLSELLLAEERFLKWYPVTKSSEKETKKHIYENYMKPRIEMLQTEKSVEELMF